MDNFDVQWSIANYLESHDLGNYRLVCKAWYNVYRKHLATRCFKCLKHSNILYNSNHCYRRVCRPCADSRFWNLKMTFNNLQHKKRLRILFDTYLEYPEFLAEKPHFFYYAYRILNQSIDKAGEPFKTYLVARERDYSILKVRFNGT
jgi:hypothetical protein